MSNGYTKLFSDIVDSSIWDEDAAICKVWVTLLALSDQNGFVRGSPGWLASKARVDLKVCEHALALFQSPDPKSRTPDFEGRRVESINDGWIVLNYLAHRDRLSTNPQSIKTRERVRKHRERYTALRNVTCVTPIHSASVSVPVPSESTDSSVEKFRGEISELYSRKQNQRWSYADECLLAEIFRRPEHESELQELIRYKSSNKQYFVKSVRKLLEQWDVLLDRSREKKPFTLKDQLI